MESTSNRGSRIVTRNHLSGRDPTPSPTQNSRHKQTHSFGKVNNAFSCPKWADMQYACILQCAVHKAFEQDLAVSEQLHIRIFKKWVELVP